MTAELHITENEARAIRVLIDACLAGMGGAHIDDLDDDPYTWVGHDNLTDAGWTQKQAEGTFGSLVNKSIVDEVEEGEFAINHDMSEVRVAWLAGEKTTDFGRTYSVRREAGDSKVAALRSIAKYWNGSRKYFIECAMDYGINKHTAATQWFQGRKSH